MKIVEERTIEQFRIGIVDKIYKLIRQETKSSLAFMKRGDYARAKFCESRIDGYHSVLGIVIDEPAVVVREE